MRNCFGTMFPELTVVEYNRPLRGFVFTVQIDSTGLVHRPPRLTVDQAAWQECQSCEAYRSCYDFCNAKLSLGQVLRGL